MFRAYETAGMCWLVTTSKFPRLFSTYNTIIQVSIFVFLRKLCPESNYFISSSAEIKKKTSNKKITDIRRKNMVQNRVRSKIKIKS